MLPFAPVRGSAWAIRHVLREAERIYYDPATVRAELARLEEQLEAGEITAEEFDQREDELLDRLETAMRSGDNTGNGT
ncbi:gas vesicle protein [Streptomyces sp. NRRL B-3648]|nr:gas vesicle protein [Streptomyces sp. NRRL B-3648]